MKSSILFLLAFFFFTSFLFSQTIQWEQLNGPFGGITLCFASNSNGDVFSGSGYNEKGVYRSTDGGLFWQRKSNGISLTDRQVDWMLVDDSSYIIIGTNSHIGSRIYKSTDNGDSWFETENLGGTSCAVNDSGHIYVGNTAYAQYSVSKDGGYTWAHYSHPSPFINCVTINDSGHIFIGGNYTGYRSKDNGANWTTLSLPDGINSIAVAPNRNLFAGCSREYVANSGVYRSTDNGDSWAPVKGGFRVYASHNIIINGNGDIIVGTWGSGIWKSTDNGDTWNQYNSGLGHFYIKSMHITNNGDVYAGLSGGGIYRSTDNGESWTQVGITVASVKKIVIDPSNNDIFTAVSGVARSTDGGQSWLPINSGLTNLSVNTIVIKDAETFFIGAERSGYNPPPALFRSTNNGSSWVNADTGLSGGSISAMTVDTEGNIYAGDNNGIYQSTNDGSNWVNTGPFISLNIKELGVNSSGDWFFSSWGQGVWRKLSGDTTWTSLATGYYTCLFVGSNDYIYAERSRSTDNGNTWTTMNNLNNGVSSYAENSLGHLFCGTYNFGSGVWHSTDYGETWEQINTGLPTMDVRSVAVDSDDYLYAGPWGYSLFKTTTSTATNIDKIKFEPVSYELNQNYPNPFNGTSVIKYSIPKSSQVSLKIFNVLGSETETLVNEEKPLGTYELNWNAANLPTGVYFYRLKAGSFVETRKMILLK